MSSQHQSITTIDKNQINQDELLSKIEQSMLGLLIIIAVVLLFAILPNYIRNRNANSDEQGNTDPTNARLPGGA
ncbi:hypothetical protein BDF21DRAFT_493738 [Thamnidium elegans]|uniref:Uncharacterized protein n=1 Tax=Thamnidium elegans TaxID=101142 RepID=A0A8H7SG75_9FUNG|nr:hypothetical protein INT48_003208 [Thamnidium elegans]KAI8080616.1 hypothetical protein BDF21DRAFT_493738 [Thamnidium elegans]